MQYAIVNSMLTTLRIKNLALVADLTVDLQPGYNVVTGETGAGKSILIGALNLVLGERAERSLIRAGADSCSVEALFDVSQLKLSLDEFLTENGLEPCDSGQLLLKRAFTSAGGNRQFINGSPTTLNILASLGESLVDIHGPHEHQSLLHQPRQLAILDAYGNLDAERQSLAGLVARRATLEAEKTSLIVDEKTYAQQLDMLRFQVNEITAARLETEEAGQVEQDYQRASNAAKLLELAQLSLDHLSESDNSLLTQAGAIGRSLQELQRFDPAAASLLALHEQAVSIMTELQLALSHYAGKVDLDPARLQQLEERLNLIHSLKRKYGPSLSEVVTFADEARRKLYSLEQRDSELQRINAELQALDAELHRAAQQLSAKRRRLIPPLAKAVTRQLDDLGFKQSQFGIAHNVLEPGKSAGSKSTELPRIPAQGLDTVEFQFAPNPGEPARPLRAIASSGELARVMLALKTVLADQDQIPLLVFDEVDANIGGETANAVAAKMQQIARKRQVLCITHLPQVAAPASTHFVATKQVKAGRTTSELNLLDPQERVTELARMLGGQSDAARKHAEALVAQSAGSTL
jgi:DNA repair protein RecN (Recombination protein N)